MEGTSRRMILLVETVCSGLTEKRGDTKGLWSSNWKIRASEHGCQASMGQCIEQPFMCRAIARRICISSGGIVNGT